MGRFYFDFRDGNGVSKDEDGEELSSALIARDVAIKSAGQAVRDLTLSSSQGRVEVEVRDSDGPVVATTNYQRPFRPQHRCPHASSTAAAQRFRLTSSSRLRGGAKPPCPAR